MNRSFWYLASPYAKYPGGMEAAYKLACRETARLIRARIPVFSPIAHSHGIAVEGEIGQTEHDIWLPADKPMIDAAHGVIMLQAESWELSRGMSWELDQFRSARKHIVWMDVGVVPDALLC